MELAKLASKPQLIEVELDDEVIIETYGESVTFFTYDRLPLDTFMKMSEGSEENVREMFETVAPLVLDKNGKQIFEGEKTVPPKVLMAAITKIVQTLGKL